MSDLSVVKRSRRSRAARVFEPTWESLRRHQSPQWLRDGKSGICTHWGISSVSAWGGSATWYSHIMYMDPGPKARQQHESTDGPLDQFGYKDCIPMLTAVEFDADEWAELCEKPGARFAGPVAQHHDGFAK